MPPASISAIASRVPSATSSGPTQRASAGQMRSRSQTLERQVVGEAAKQRHRGMRVRVDEARQQRVVRALVADARRVAAVGIANRQHVDDAARVDRERETFLGDDFGLDAKGPSRTDQGVDRLHRRGSRRSQKGEQV